MSMESPPASGGKAGNEIGSGGDTSTGNNTGQGGSDSTQGGLAGDGGQAGAAGGSGQLSCDPSVTVACTLTTPLGSSCAGTQTCLLTGLSACQAPASSDLPDDNYTDQNCDGIDGEASAGIFVSPGGADDASCGQAPDKPCQTISYGVIRAATTQKSHVYVQAGAYNEVVVPLNGINIWGGYDSSWQRGPYTAPAHRVSITGRQDVGTGGDGEWLTVRAHDLLVPARIDNVVIVGPDAQGAAGPSGNSGKSSYAVHARGALLSLTHVEIHAGRGAPGLVGSAGADATIVSAVPNMNGQNGGDGAQFNSNCDGSTRGAAGPAGTNTCNQSPSGRAMNGGPGGRGGTMDTSCIFSALDLNATSGDNGVNASFVSGAAGLRGTGGSGRTDCGATSNGNPGLSVNGPPGTAVAGASLFNASYWYALAGISGGTGENGSGGGGGGGSGGCDTGIDAYGPGGGGGAAGGCAARTGGGGGGGGGASFGIFLTGNSSVSVDTCTLYRGFGGSGGSGGIGGRGQSGGAGGSGGSLHPSTATPGNGGAGAHGGHGGGGGGGEGGSSIGVLLTPGSTFGGTCGQQPGSAGPGGPGGVSAPTAPLAERDGNQGQPGFPGTEEAVRTCSGATTC